MSEETVDPSAKRRAPGLGRGLSALLGDVAPAETGSHGDGVREISIVDIAPHPGQPRRVFDDAALDELAASIRARGVLQPIVVRKVNDKYQIVAGERRWRAAQRAQLHAIPAIVRSFDDAVTLEVALLENIQRADLNAIEEGEAYARLTAEFGHSQEALARIVHKSRSHVANLMRLLDLPPSVRDMIADGRLSMGHARALINSPHAQAIADEAVIRGLSVREVEKLVRKGREPKAGAKKPAIAGVASDADVALLERQLGDILGLNVRISHNGAAGTVTLSYATLDQLDMICQRLSGEGI